LTAEAIEAGRGRRTSSFCHRHLESEPLALVLWQLGAEPFSVAAAAWGTSEDRVHSAVAGDPRDRTLAFAALLELATQFNPWFEAPAADREADEGGYNENGVARRAPQIVVANGPTLALLGRLGRRLAYLPIDGEHAADPQLVRFGRHLQFLHEHAGRPGQQLVVVLTELVGSNWATGQTSVERQSLAALDAWIAPPEGMDGFAAAALAEEFPVGPLPRGDDDERLDPLIARFNEVREKQTDPRVVAPLLAPIADHYRPLLAGAWEVVWRCLRREAEYPEAPSCSRRWLEDRRAYSRHMDWMEQAGGLRRGASRCSRRSACGTS
jgi:hypothetical protein